MLALILEKRPLESSFASLRRLWSPIPGIFPPYVGTDLSECKRKGFSSIQYHDTLTWEVPIQPHWVSVHISVLSQLLKRMLRLSSGLSPCMPKPEKRICVDRTWRRGWDLNPHAPKGRRVSCKDKPNFLFSTSWRWRGGSRARWATRLLNPGNTPELSLFMIKRYLGSSGPVSKNSCEMICIWKPSRKIMRN